VVRCECGRACYNAPKVETGEAARTVTTVHNGIRPKQRARILARDNRTCVMCHAADRPLHVGHLLSVDAGLSVGLTEAELNDDSNLASMCDECNLGLGAEPIPLRIYAAIVKLACKGVSSR
jgi:5-methylcytosine-specific restriction endonuclease McrA